MRSPRTCSGRLRTGPRCARPPTGPRPRPRRRRRALAFEDAASYLATALAAADAAGASEADRATLLIELATAEYRAGQLATSLQHAVAAADAAEPARRLDLLADAALVVRGIGHHQVAVTLLGLCDRALADPDCPAARRARLLAQRASALAEIGDMEAADADSAAAMTAAQAAGDPAAELDAIRARVAALSAPQHRTEWLRLGARTVELAAATGQPIAAVLGRVWRIDASYQLMNLEAVDTEIALIAQLAESTRLPLARWHLLRQQASRAALAGQFATARDRSEEARQLAVRIQDLSGAGMSYAFALCAGDPPRRRHRAPAGFLRRPGGRPADPGHPGLASQRRCSRPAGPTRRGPSTRPSASCLPPGTGTSARSARSSS